MASFGNPIRRISARACGVILEDSSGNRSFLGFRRTVRVAAGSLFLEPERSDWYAWVAFRSWRSERQKCLN